MCVNGPPPAPIREAIEAMALADAIHGRVGRLDVVVPLQISGDPNRTGVARRVQVSNLFDRLIRRLARMIVGTVLAPREPRFAKLAIPVSPQVESEKRRACKCPTNRRKMARRKGFERTRHSLVARASPLRLEAWSARSWFFNSVERLGGWTIAMTRPNVSFRAQVPPKSHDFPAPTAPSKRRHRVRGQFTDRG
jgi:hypothetical protein